MNSLKYYINRVPNIPKTLLFNFYYLPFKQAIRFPIFVGGRVKINSLGDRTALKVDTTKLGFVQIGSGKGPHGMANRNGCWDISSGARIHFEGKFISNKGLKFIAKKNAELFFGDGTTMGPNGMILCEKKISIGKECMLSWNVQLMDSDGHPIFVDGECINYPKEITLGDHIWCAENVTILKGSRIPDECIIGSHAVVTGSKYNEHDIIAGCPAKTIKSNATWSRTDF